MQSFNSVFLITFPDQIASFRIIRDFRSSAAAGPIPIAADIRDSSVDHSLSAYNV